MTEVTRVPLQPIAKGALTKLWLGVAAAAAAAAGLACASLPPGIGFETLKAGTGASPTMADVALINYKGTLPDGKVFDEGKQAALPLEGVVPGFTKALLRMQKGGKYKVVIPPELGYGDKAQGPIPANTTLTFEIELLEFKNRAEIEAQMRMMQQLQAMQAQQGGAGAPPPPSGAQPQ
jgi:FKBP-type peptidyl-prolyl cis-trans isomerase FkpA